MTCIVGIEYDGGVLIGADSATTGGWRQTIRVDEKAFTNGAYIIGVSGSPRLRQLLRYSLNIGAPNTWDVDRFIATTFVDAVRTTLKEGGVAKMEYSQEAMGGSSFLVGVAGQLYAINDDYQFTRSVDGYMAVGCGDEIALGSLHTTAKLGIDPRARAQHALEAAAWNSAGVAGPFTIIESADQCVS